LAPGQGAAECQTAGHLLVAEDLKEGSNAEMEPKDFFEMGSIQREAPGAEADAAHPIPLKLRGMAIGSRHLLILEALLRSLLPRPCSSVSSPKQAESLREGPGSCRGFRTMRVGYALAAYLVGHWI
jgi:hypothetical protein